MIPAMPPERAAPPTEREVKLTAPPGFRLPDLGDVVEGATATPPETLDLRATYYDTADLRLIRWGCTLRYRNTDGWTVKLPAADHGPVMVRPELSFPGSPARPPPEAVELVAALVRREPLVAVARLHTTRRKVEVRDSSGNLLSEVVDDEVSLLDGRRMAARFRELEVELAPEAPEWVLQACIHRLEAAGASVADPVPKLVHALGPRAIEPPDAFVDGLAPTPMVADVIRHALTSSVARFLRHEPGVVLGTDPEDVHQTRVALRRLRSDVHTFGPFLEETWTARLREEAQWLAGLLGRVRDADVMRARLAETAARLPDQPAPLPFVARLERDRDAARAELLAARRQPRFVALVDLLVDAAHNPALLPEAKESAADALRALVTHRWRNIRRVVSQLDQRPDDEDLHNLRILAKRLRYGAEAIAPATGKSAQKLAAAAAELQDVLGGHHDAVVTIAWLRGEATTSSADLAFVAGELCGLELAAAEEARKAWPAAWQELRRHRPPKSWP